MGGGGERGQRIGERTLTHDSEGRHIAEEANDKHRQQYQNSGEAPHLPRMAQQRSDSIGSSVFDHHPSKANDKRQRPGPQTEHHVEALPAKQEQTAVAIIRTWSSRSCRRAPVIEQESNHAKASDKGQKTLVIPAA